MSHRVVSVIGSHFNNDLRKSKSSCAARGKKDIASRQTSECKDPEWLGGSRRHPHGQSRTGEGKVLRNARSEVG